MLRLLLVIVPLGSYKPSEWKKDKVHWFRGTYMVWHFILMDEENQVNGYKFLADFSEFSMAHQTFFTVEEMKGMLIHFQVRTHLPLIWGRAINDLQMGVGWECDTVKLENFTD